MMKISMIASATAFMTLLIAAPVAADPEGRGDRHSDDRRSWQGSRYSDAIRANYRPEQQRDRIHDRRDERQDERRAYAAGYRDANRANSYLSGAYRAQPHYDRAQYGSPTYHNAGAQRYPSYQSSPYWYGNNGRINCRRSDGSTGVIVGAIAGGTLGNILAGSGDKRMGSIIGGSLGAILGKEIARGNGYCR